MNKKSSRMSRGFTIVELLIVIVIIGILATIVIVAYNGITTKARQATLQSDLANSRSKLEIANATDGQYPSGATVNASPKDYLAQSSGSTLAYHTNANQDTYCLSAIGSDNIMYVVSNLAGPYKGSCTGANNEVATEGTGIPPVMAVDGAVIQTITTTTCPTSNKIRAVDARDNHTYWVQKLADGQCWMLTNLGYAGGGTNTYGDVKTFTDGTGGSVDYLNPKYYIVPSTTNFTAEPTAPSTSTNGTGQYGYLYNWCAAMGSQTSTSTCDGSTNADNWNHNISICPSGWRLPTGNSGELGELNNTVNGGATDADSGLIDAPWLGQRSGYWGSGFISQGNYGYYWSSNIDDSGTINAYSLRFSAVGAVVDPSYSSFKYFGRAVRCVAV